MLTYHKYLSLGYDFVSEVEFNRLHGEMCAAVGFFTFARLNGDFDDSTACGMCEIIDLIKRRKNDDTGNLASFSNEGYSESYKSVGTLDMYAEIYALMTVWFDRSLLARGID